MAGVFIVSFDCEGKWGLADHAESKLLLFKNHILTEAYSNLLGILDKHCLRATFAFVAAYCMDRDAYEERRAWFDHADAFQQHWMALFSKNLAEGDVEGWFNPRPLELVKASMAHEIASHGFTHRPLCEDLTDADQFDRELSSSMRYFAGKGCPIKTFIYPRNQIGHVERLSRFGIVGYREAKKSPNAKLVKRALSLASEFRSSPACPHSEPSDPVAIPAGHFLNHRAGLRCLVPPILTYSKWKGIVDDAIRNEKVIHLWSHPHNFVTGSRMYESLENILAYVAEKARQGLIRNQTQFEYAVERLSTPS